MEFENNYEKNTSEKNTSKNIIEGIIIKEDASWQNLIYDLVKSNQINPWDVDIIELTNKFLEKIEEMDKKNLYLSSKILLVAAILIKMKAEWLYLSLSEKDEKKKEKQKEIIEMPEDLPMLLPKAPFERERKITLDELMDALKKAVKTEERRIRREIINQKPRIDLSFILPTKKINWVEKIREVYIKIREKFKKYKTKRLLFSQLLEKNDKEEKITLFVPLIHLDFQKKIQLEQKSFLGDIEIKLNAGVPEPGQTGRT